MGKVDFKRKSLNEHFISKLKKILSSSINIDVVQNKISQINNLVKFTSNRSLERQFQVCTMITILEDIESVTILDKKVWGNAYEGK